MSACDFLRNYSSSAAVSRRRRLPLCRRSLAVVGGDRPGVDERGLRRSPTRPPFGCTVMFPCFFDSGWPEFMSLSEKKSLMLSNGGSVVL